MSEQLELIRRAQTGDQEASERLVTDNSGLIWSVARRFIGRGVESDDLYQLGCLGFLKAVDGFDLRRNILIAQGGTPSCATECSHTFQHQFPHFRGKRSAKNSILMIHYCPLFCQQKNERFVAIAQQKSRCPSLYALNASCAP